MPIARQIAEALEAAHDHGVMHRDLKLANIKITDAGGVWRAQRNRRYAVAPDGQRFLFLKIVTGASADNPPQQLLFVGNWFEELKQRVPN